MQIDKWLPFYKYDDLTKKQNCMSQQTYEPLISPDGKIFCANYDYNNKYQRLHQPNRSLYTKEVVDYFFDKEVHYASKYQSKSWAPEIIDIDAVNKRIFYNSCHWSLPTDLCSTGDQQTLTHHISYIDYG